MKQDTEENKNNNINDDENNKNSDALKLFQYIRKYKTFLPYLIVFVICLLLYIFFRKDGIKIENKVKNSSNTEMQNFSKDKVYYHEIKDMLVQINGDIEDKFLKITLVIQTNNRTVLENIKELLPRIDSDVQAYLRQLKQSDFNSSFGMYKIQGDILLRLNNILRPNKIDAVYIKDIMIK